MRTHIIDPIVRTGFLGCATAVREHLLANGRNVPAANPIPATACAPETLGA